MLLFIVPVLLLKSTSNLSRIQFCINQASISGAAGGAGGEAAEEISDFTIIVE